MKQMKHYKEPERDSGSGGSGCLVPEKVDGLLLAGRCISGTHMAHANFRAMPICANMGQAAGIAAALCVKANQQPRQLNVDELQKVLMDHGVSL